MEDKTSEIAKAKLAAECLPDEKQAVAELEALCQGKQFCASAHQVLGVGSSRTAYSFYGCCLKVARDERGRAQTLHEAELFAGQACFARLLGVSEDGQWCLMEKLQPAKTELELLEALTVRCVRLRDALEQCFAGHLEAREAFMRRLSCKPAQRAALDAVFSFYEERGWDSSALHPGDLARKSNWGTDADGIAKLVDYGTSAEVLAMQDPAYMREGDLVL